MATRFFRDVRQHFEIWKEDAEVLLFLRKAQKQQNLRLAFFSSKEFLMFRIVGCEVKARK